MGFQMIDYYGLSRISDEVYLFEGRERVNGYQELDKAHVTFDAGIKATTYFHKVKHHY